MNFQLIKIHKWALLLAFLVGIIVAFPQFYFPYDHSEIYQGIYIANSDSEAYYLNRVQMERMILIFSHRSMRYWLPIWENYSF